MNDPERDEGAPAFSPDGSLIAFHRSGRTGGIFVAGATGESVRRLTDVGFDPAWSPDGKQIVFATEEIVDPASSHGDSGLYVVDVSGGSAHQLLELDAVQSSWSPSGERTSTGAIATPVSATSNTIAAAGGMPTAVTMDP